MIIIRSNIKNSVETKFHLIDEIRILLELNLRENPRSTSTYLIIFRLNPPNTFKQIRLHIKISHLKDNGQECKTKSQVHYLFQMTKPDWQHTAFMLLRHPKKMSFIRRRLSKSTIFHDVFHLSTVTAALRILQHIWKFLLLDWSGLDWKNCLGCINKYQWKKA